MVLQVFWGSKVLGLYAHDHLLAAEERVADELARAQGHLAFRHVGGVDVVVGFECECSPGVGRRCQSAQIEIRRCGPVLAKKFCLRHQAAIINPGFSDLLGAILNTTQQVVRI